MIKPILKKHYFHCIKGCVRCCTDRGNPLELTFEDIMRLCHYLSIDAAVFFERYCGIIWNRIPDTTFLVPSIGLSFPCKFLEADECSIYDFRPIHCRLFPESLMSVGKVSFYLNSGYKCVDRGMTVSKKWRFYIDILNKMDMEELEATASYFENFKYCVEVNPEEFERTSSLLKDADTMGKAEKRRELLTETISRKKRDEVRYEFMDKLERLNAGSGEIAQEVSFAIK